MLPDTDGLSLCRALRAERDIPVLFLSAKGEEIDRVVGLEVGGDDYLTKPFSPRELVTRVRAILRRHRPNSALDTHVRRIRAKFRALGGQAPIQTVRGIGYKVRPCDD